MNYREFVSQCCAVAVKPMKAECGTIAKCTKCQKTCNVRPPTAPVEEDDTIEIPEEDEQ